MSAVKKRRTRVVVASFYCYFETSLLLLICVYFSLRRKARRKQCRPRALKQQPARKRLQPQNRRRSANKSRLQRFKNEAHESQRLVRHFLIASLTFAFFRRHKRSRRRQKRHKRRQQQNRRRSDQREIDRSNWSRILASISPVSMFSTAYRKSCSRARRRAYDAAAATRASSTWAAR